MIAAESEANDEHQAVAERDYHCQSNKRGRDAADQKVSHLEVSLTSLRILHHNSSYRRVSRGAAMSEQQKHSLMFGNPLVGRPMAALAISTLPITSKFGCGSSMF